MNRFLLFISAAFLGLLVSQTSCAEGENIQAAINRDVWLPYSRSYADVDGPLHRSLYHPEIIRVLSGHKAVEGGDAYLDHVLKYMAQARKNRVDMHIDFRFSKRVNSDEEAFEEGIYRYLSKGTDGVVFEAYSRFYAIHRLVDGRWRLLVDLDMGEASVEDWEAAPIRMASQ